MSLVHDFGTHFVWLGKLLFLLLSSLQIEDADVFLHFNVWSSQ